MYHKRPGPVAQSFLEGRGKYQGCVCTPPPPWLHATHAPEPQIEGWGDQAGESSKGGKIKILLQKHEGFTGFPGNAGFSWGNSVKKPCEKNAVKTLFKKTLFFRRVLAEHEKHISLARSGITPLPPARRPPARRGVTPTPRSGVSPPCVEGCHPTARRATPCQGQRHGLTP